MSQFSDAVATLKSSGDIPAFIAGVAGDLQKDFQILSALPGVKTFEAWLASIIEAELAKIGLSPTLVSLISMAVNDAL